MIELTSDVMALLALVAFCAGFFDAITGGGGLITLPVLFLSGVDPMSAIATNKFQATCATLSATTAFARKGLIQWRDGKFLILCAGLGGASGAMLVSLLNKRWLEAGVPIMLLTIAIYFACAPQFENEVRRQRMSIAIFSFTIAPFLGFYDGIFGPGTGSFFMLGFILLCGLGMMHAIGFSKLANAASNAGSLAMFIISGAIIWPIALVMAVASFVGAQLGAHAAMRVGSRLIKPMLIIVCCALTIKLLSAANNPLRIAILELL
jgi:uncharacterized membrane protein YfcA